ncbi:hypothetical protein B0H10DRAFT_2379937, partial [Mycena sp. CBHHK59/15]
SAQAANHAIRHSLFVDGKRVPVRKLLSEPIRCLKCQARTIPRLHAPLSTTSGGNAGRCTALTRARGLTTNAPARTALRQNTLIGDTGQRIAAAQCLWINFNSHSKGTQMLITGTSLRTTPPPGNAWTGPPTTSTTKRLPGKTGTRGLEVTR